MTLPNNTTSTTLMLLLLLLLIVIRVIVLSKLRSSSMRSLWGGRGVGGEEALSSFRRISVVDDIYFIAIYQSIYSNML